MDLSIVIPIRDNNTDIVDYVVSVQNVAAQIVKTYEVVLTMSFFEEQFAEFLKANLPSNCRVVVVEDGSDCQQTLMAGYKQTSGDAVMQISKDYNPELIQKYYDYWKAGDEVVCGERKLSKFRAFMAKVGLGIYNFMLKIFGEVYSIGILKDIELLDREVVDIMVGNQAYAHRIRTMYAPVEYNARIVEIDEPVREKVAPVAITPGLKMGALSLVLVGLLFIAGLIVLPIIHAGPLAWVFLIIGFIFLGFIALTICVNAVARSKIGGLHKAYNDGNIFRLSENQIEILAKKQTEVKGKKEKGKDKKEKKTTKEKTKK